MKRGDGYWVHRGVVLRRSGKDRWTNAPDVSLGVPKLEGATRREVMDRVDAAIDYYRFMMDLSKR